ncbi:hypothetical protein [Mycobacterium genavense]|uniref:hypothetical protein n=1 Tax=Mycobacterium genavense TaxID=36812 RepID=UPI0004711497|nr:hypothetical protein [Mycobacterium genavense]
MTLVRASLAEGFYFGDDAVLLALDAAGLNAFLAALTLAVKEGPSRLELDGTTNHFLIESSGSEH